MKAECSEAQQMEVQYLMLFNASMVLKGLGALEESEKTHVDSCGTFLDLVFTKLQQVKIVHPPKPFTSRTLSAIPESTFLLPSICLPPPLPPAHAKYREGRDSGLPKVSAETPCALCWTRFGMFRVFFFFSQFHFAVPTSF